jgi:hypothetical protein
LLPLPSGTSMVRCFINLFLQRWGIGMSKSTRQNV